METRRSQVFWQGLMAGLIGYATVAVVMALVNVIAGRSPFFTAALLGQSLFYDLSTPAGLVIWPGPVLAYNGLHLVLFLGLGMVTAWIAYEAERGPHFWYIGAVVMAFVIFHLFGAFLFVTEPVRVALPVWTFALAGALALAAMTVYLVSVHPRLIEELKDFAAGDADLAETTR